MDDLLQEFIAETRETMTTLSSEIVAWEADPDDRQRLDAIFRFVHTVKGSCGFLDLPRLARLSHAAEDALAQVRAGDRTADRALVNAVLAVVDRIGDIVEAIDGGVALADTGEEQLVAALSGGSADQPIAIPADAPTGIVQRAPTRSVRLSVELLDKIMSGMSEMVLARNELARRMRDQADPDPRVDASLERLSMTVAELRDTVTRTRMQKIDTLFSALPRMVRDIGADLGKSVSLTIQGADVELDREMIEMIRDPLTHIVRNSLDHGIEAPAARRAAGKAEHGRLSVAARQSGNQIVIEVEDDGRGIDVDRVIAKMTAAGTDAAVLAALDPQQQLELVFQPGLSTKDVVSTISGRGVGMDVVRANVEQIGGRIALVNRPGHGLTTVIQVPLTLSIIPAIVVEVGGARFALPRQTIEEIVSLTAAAAAVRIDTLGDRAVATVRGERLPLVALDALLRLPRAVAGDPGLLAVVAVPGGRLALAIHAVLDSEELVVKPAAPIVMATGLYAGQTLPDNGSPMLLLDGAGIAREAGIAFERAVIASEAAQVQADGGIPVLLFTDLDGARRAVALDAVDRVDTVAGEAVRFTAGGWHLDAPEGLIALHATAALGERASVAVLHLTDGTAMVGYAIAEPIDIVTLDADIVPAREAGLLAGVVVHDGQQVELIDLHWLFAALGAPRGRVSARPLCLLDGPDAGWIATFLGPIIARAGYRVASSLRDGEVAAVLLTTAAEDDAGSGPGPEAAAVRIRLSADRTTGTDRTHGLYRYDRDAIEQALVEARGGRR